MLHLLLLRKQRLRNVKYENAYLILTWQATTQEVQPIKKPKFLAPALVENGQVTTKESSSSSSSAVSSEKPQYFQVVW